MVSVLSLLSGAGADSYVMCLQVECGMSSVRMHRNTVDMSKDKGVTFCSAVAL